MAMPVISGQSSVIRSLLERSRSLRFLTIILISFLMTDHWHLTPAAGKDCGIHGMVSEIEEEDPIAAIQKKLKRWEENGELEKHQEKLQKKTRIAIERPHPVKGITHALQNRTWFVDPSYTVPRDFADHEGRVFAKKGERINTLEGPAGSEPFIFFDGDNEDQKAWVEEQLEESVTLILVKGAPLALSEEWERPVFFDQGGTLTKKLGIKHVPARMTQEGLRLKVEEILLDKEDQ